MFGMIFWEWTTMMLCTLKNEYSIKKGVIPKINFKGNNRLKMIIRPNFRLITNIRNKLNNW